MAQCFSQRHECSMVLLTDRPPHSHSCFSTFPTHFCVALQNNTGLCSQTHTLHIQFTACLNSTLSNFCYLLMCCHSTGLKTCVCCWCTLAILLLKVSGLSACPVVPFPFSLGNFLFLTCAKSKNINFYMLL